MFALLGILAAGQPTAEQRYPHRLEVPSADDTDPRELLVLDPRLGPAFYFEPICRAAPAHWQIVGEADPRYLGFALEPAKEFRTKRAYSIVTHVRALGQ